MEVYEKLTKQISETKYLSAENTYRYRPIMRYFYKCYERMQYWLYKEEVFSELRDNDLIPNYTLEDCERDLEVLVEWMSLSKMQDTKNATTIEEFKNKKFRYQMTEYAVEIERLSIRLEDMNIKTASLEPKLFDRIRVLIEKLVDVNNLSDDECNGLWEDLNESFTKLNQNYQDFLKKFNEPKSEELLQSVLFLQFKNEIVKYLREFVKGYQSNVYYIRGSINLITREMIDSFFDKINNYNKRVTVLNKAFDFKYFKSVNQDKLQSIFNWFMPHNGIVSEGEKLMDTTDNIIVKITKYANSLIELRGNMTNRKEEYKHITKLFDSLDSVEEAHKYASIIFGIENVRHFVGISNINTDTIVNSYDVAPIEISLQSRTRLKKEKVALQPISDKKSEKEKILREYREQLEQNQKILRKLIKDKKIVLSDEVNLSILERKYILKLLAGGKNTNKESEFGLSYSTNKIDGTCKIVSEDGVFIMDAVEVLFDGELKNMGEANGS